MKQIRSSGAFKMFKFTGRYFIDNGLETRDIDSEMAWYMSKMSNHEFLIRCKSYF